MLRSCKWPCQQFQKDRAREWAWFLANVWREGLMSQKTILLPSNCPGLRDSPGSIS